MFSLGFRDRGLGIFGVGVWGLGALRGVGFRETVFGVPISKRIRPRIQALGFSLTAGSQKPQTHPPQDRLEYRFWSLGPLRV